MIPHNTYHDVGKMEFTLSGIVSPDALIGRHKTQQAQQHSLSGLFKEGISIDIYLYNSVTIL